ncbi:MAG: carboxypeptidase-like regulatory domain-containing protein [Muribaculaceae bacterium]
MFKKHIYACAASISIALSAVASTILLSSSNPATNAFTEPDNTFRPICQPVSQSQFRAHKSPVQAAPAKEDEGATTSLATPRVLPATDIQPASYTANWSAVDNAEGYLVFPRIIHTADGITPYYIVNTTFDKITEGSTGSPVLPQYVINSMDDYMEATGWLCRIPLQAGGALGLTNRFLDTYGNSLLQSPTLDLSGASGNVDISLRYLAQDVDMFQVSMYQIRPDGSVSLRATKMIYTGEEYDVWKDVSFTLGGGTSSAMLVILLPETTRGTIFLDSLNMSQQLDEGTRYIVPGATLQTEATSIRVETPDAVVGDTRSYSVQAYRIEEDNVIYSTESNSIIVGADSDEVPEELVTPAPALDAVNGSQFTARWEPVAGANAYDVQLYRRHTSNGNETTTIINENFDRIQVGTTDLDYPRAMHLDGYDRLDDFTAVPGWEVFQGFYVDGAVGILGYWNMLGVGCYMKSPVFDLSADSGKMTLSLKVGSDYYNQGATVYLAHDNPETGGIIYDDMLPLDEMEKGFHSFSTVFTKGRKDSYFVFYPYGYGVSYFDDILVTQNVPAGTHDTAISHRTTSECSVTMTVPTVNPADEYYFTVRALYIDAKNIEKTASEPCDMIKINGLQPTTYYSGKVVDTNGDYIANATVTLTAPGVSAPLHAVTNQWGLFRIENISRADVEYTATVSAQGYRTARVAGITFTDLQPVADALFTLRAADGNSIEIGIPTAPDANGPLCLQYNNSDTETIYSADALGLPAGTVIRSVAYDGYCLTDKEVTYEIALRMANDTGSDTFDTPAPKVGQATEPFWSGSVTLNRKGTQALPEELLSFSNENGFEYTGGALRVSLSARATRNSEFYFFNDATAPGTSICRYWSRGAEGEWKVNTSGRPVVRLVCDLPSGITETVILDNGYTVRPVSGGLQINAPSPCTVSICSVSGACVASVSLTANETLFVPLAPGLYIAGHTKIAIK